MNLSPEVLQTIDHCFTRFFQAHKPLGLVYAVTLRGEVVHSGAFGAQRLNPDEPVTSVTVSRIASMTKSFAAVAALQLRDAGLLDINAPISSIAPRLKVAEPFASASVSELMSMRLDLVTDDPWADRLLGSTNEEIDPYFQQTMLRAGLGYHRCAYSNISYFLLGRLIALVSGRPLMEYISHHITGPLGMLSTVWNPPAQLDSRIALGYRADTFPYVEEERYECRSDAVAFGGLWSCVHDLAIWLEFLRASNTNVSWESVLCAKSRAELTTPHASYDTRSFESTITGHSIDRRAGYGFGIVRSSLLRTESLHHSGGIPGYGSHMRVDVQNGFGVIALSNGTYCPVWNPCADSLLHIVSSVASSVLIDLQRVVEIGQRLAHCILSDNLGEQQDLFTYNFWLDNRREVLRSILHSAIEGLGDAVRISRVNCHSGFQGEISFSGTRGDRILSFQLSPFLPAQIQQISWI